MQDMIRDLAQQHSKFRDIAADVLEILGFDLCIVWRLDKKERRFYVAGWDGTLDEAYRQTIFLNAETIQRDESIQKGVPIYISDLTDPQKAANYLYRQEAKERGWTTLIRVPLAHQKRLIGIIDSYTYQPFKFLFSEHKRVIMSSLRAFANQAAEALRNIDLSNRLETLQDINQLLTGIFDEQTIVRQILAKSLELVGADLGHIYLMDINRGCLVLKESIGIPDELVEHTRKLGQGLTGDVANTGVAENIPDVSKDVRHTPILGVPINSKVAVPLRREEQTIGVLSVKSRFYNAFTDDDVNLLTALATQAAIAIERAKLNRHLQEVSRLALGEDYMLLLNYVVLAVRDLTGADVNLWMLGGREEARGEYLQIEASSGKIGEHYIKNTQLPIDSDISINVLALREKRSIIRPDIQNDSEKPQFYQIERAIERGWHCFMAVPLIGEEDEPLGTLSLYSKEIAKFGPPEIELMQPFANQVAIALQQQQKNRQLQVIRQRQADELEALHQTTLKITAQENVDSLLQALVEEATKLLKGNGGKVYLKVPNQNKIKLVAAKNVNPAFLRVGETFPSGEGMTGKVMESKEPLIIDNYPKWPERIERVAHLFTAMIEAPLLLDEQAIGVISVFTDEREFKFTNEDAYTLKRLAQQAALAIHNASLFEEVQDKVEFKVNTVVKTAASLYRQIQAQSEAEIKAIRKIATSISIAPPIGIKEVLQKIIYSMISLMGRSNLFTVTLLDKKTNELELVVYEGEIHNEGDPWRLKIGEGITGWVAQHKMPLVVPDVRKDDRYLPGLVGGRSELAVPMLKGEELIGVLNIEHPEVNAFTDKHVQLAEAIAGLAVVAIENNRLFEQLTDRATRLEHLQEVTTTISAEPSDLENVLRLIVDSLSEIFDDSQCVIRLYDTKKDKFTHQVAQTTAVPKEQTLDAPRSNGISRYVLKTKEPYYIEDSDHTQPVGQPTIRQTIVDQGIRAMGALPLKSENEVIGVLYLNLKTPHQFTQNDKQILELFANQTAVAIKNAQLYRQIQAQSEAEIKAIRKIATSISIAASLGIKEVLQRVIHSMVSLMGKSALFNVWLLNQNTNVLELVAYEGKIDEEIYPFHLKIGEGIIGSAARHKESQSVPDVRQDERYVPGFVGGRSELAVPMLKGDELIGVLSVEHPEVDVFTESDVQLGEAIASLAVVALENNQLQEAQERATAAEKLAVIGYVTAEFVHRMNNLAGTIPPRLNMAKEYLRDDEPRDAKVIKQLNKVTADTLLLLDAVQKIKRTTEQRAPEDVQINQLLEEALEIVCSSQPQAKGQIEVERQFSLDLPVLHLDRRHVLDCLISVIRNAVQAMPNGGTLSLSTVTSTMKDKACVQIAIKDNGVGISAENLAKIFDLFFTTKERGLGYGLWRDKTLIKMLGGDIEAESVEGVGSTFIIQLPVVSSYRWD